MSLEIRNNMISRMVLNNKSLVPSDEMEQENDGVVKNNPEPADPGVKANDVSNNALIANILGRPLVTRALNFSGFQSEKLDNTQTPDEKIEPEYQGRGLTNEKGFGPYGAATADEARAQFKDIPDKTFDKFFEVVEINGQYGVQGKEPYAYYHEKSENQVYMGVNCDFDEDGKPCNVQPNYGTQTTYTLKDTQGGGSVKITVGANVGPANGSIQYLDSNGKAIDSDGSINRNAIDCSVIEGYGVGLNNAETLHERGKGWSGSKAKMEEKATEMLNGNKFKSQIEAQYKTLVSSTGGTYDEKAFESFYQKAINQTLQTDGMITGRGARGLSKKGHAYCNVYNLVSTFLRNFDEMTKVK